MSLRVNHLNFAYQKETPVLKDLTVAIPKGKITALIGRNGCGKSTLLKIMNRLLPCDSGEVFLEEREINTYGSKELARTLAHLAQAPTAPDGLTVRELVDFGRHPHKGLLGRTSAKDREAVTSALHNTSLDHLADRPLTALSGGQRQRAWIAMALAQDTEYLLLDEPTTYLDIAHQLEVLELLSRLNQQENKTIVMVVHDPNHASQYAHHVVALRQGELFKVGTPAELFTEENIQELFGVTPLIFEGPSPDKPWCVPYKTLDR